MSKILRDMYMLSDPPPGSLEHPEAPPGTPIDSLSRCDVSESGETDAVASEGRPGSREYTITSSSSRVCHQSAIDPRPGSHGAQDVSDQCRPMSPPNPDSSAGVREKVPRKEKSRKRKWVNPQLVLQNSGSVARDHLASERTFLAYVRTSLALASAGVALVQLFTIADLTSRSNDVPLSDANRQVQKFAKPLGVTMVLFALIMLVIGMHRYFLVQKALPDQKFPPARLSVAFTSFALGSITIVIFGALLSGRVNS